MESSTSTSATLSDLPPNINGTGTHLNGGTRDILNNPVQVGPVLTLPSGYQVNFILLASPEHDNEDEANIKNSDNSYPSEDTNQSGEEATQEEI